jgi:hypothetical protein
LPSFETVKALSAENVLAASKGASGGMKIGPVLGRFCWASAGSQHSPSIVCPMLYQQYTTTIGPLVYILLPYYVPTVDILLYLLVYIDLMSVQFHQTLATAIEVHFSHIKC